MSDDIIKIDQDPNLPPAAHWLGVKMVIFENGEIYGEVLCRGTEQAVTDKIIELASVARGPHWQTVRIPAHMAGKRIVNVNYNAIGIFMSGTILEQIHLRAP